MDLKLRPYQEEIIEAVYSEHAKGVMRQCVVLPTGAGKTASAISFCRSWWDSTIRPENSRILWLTHRDELVQQATKAVSTWWPGHPSVGVVKAERDEFFCDFVVASVQTLAREKRMQNLLNSDGGIFGDYGKFGLVISDEHHYSPAPVWSKVLEDLGCGQPDGPLMIGLTATPKRADGVGLKVTTDAIVYEKNIIWGIENGFLVPPVGRAVDVDLSQVKISQGDYQLGSLGDALEFANAHHMVASMVQKYASDRKTIVFTPTVMFAQLVMEECRKMGFAAEMVSGETPSEERQGMYARLRSGDTKIIVNCNVLVEGFDEPSVDCVVMARPTKSQTLFIQAVGRGLRTFPGKQDCLVIALAGSERNKLVTLADLAGSEYSKELKEDEKEDELFDLIGSLNVQIKRKAEKFGLKARQIDLLGMVQKKVAWAMINQSMFAKRIPKNIDDRQPVIVWKQELPADTWKVCEVTEQKNYVKRSKVLLSGVDFDTAQNFANDHIKSILPPAFVNPSATWRNEPVSEKQLEQLKKWRVPFNPKTVTRGEASALLDAVFLRKFASAA